MSTQKAGLLQRVRDWRTRMKRDRYERKIRARENLRDYKKPTGDE